jgi:hypothetical protein
MTAGQSLCHFVQSRFGPRGQDQVVPIAGKTFREIHANAHACTGDECRLPLAASPLRHFLYPLQIPDFTF